MIDIASARTLLIAREDEANKNVSMYIQLSDYVKAERCKGEAIAYHKSIEIIDEIMQQSKEK